jgi:exopolysaccharide production protein ExoZ
MISNLQLLRGMAALAVVFYHGAFVIPGMQHTDFQAVAVFFVISGFIMTYITRDSADGFLRDRIFRIVPLYWIATIVYVIWTKFGLNNIPVSWTDPRQVYGQIRYFFQHDQTAFFGDLASSLFFIPRGFDSTGSPVFPLLGVGWTLNLEMFFYVIFATMLAISRRWAPLLAGTFLWLLIEYSHRVGCNDLCRFYAHNYVQFFIYGIAVFYAWRILAGLLISAAARTIAIGACAAAVAGFFAVEISGIQGFELIAPVALVFALLTLHSASVRCDWRWVEVFGGASYALYLTHVTVLETIRPFSPNLPLLDFSTRPFGVAVLLIACLLVAVHVHQHIERPIMRWLRRRGGLDRSRDTASGNPVPLDGSPRC